MNNRQINFIYAMEEESKKRKKAKEQNKDYESPCDFML